MLISSIGSVATNTHKILEIGAGLAWMCRVAKIIDVKNITVAQDATFEVASECPWVDYYVVADATDYKIDYHGPYDIISLTHVIEDVPKPVEILQRLCSVLCDDGIVFLTAPYRPTGWREFEKDPGRWIDYSYNHTPAHLQYFSERSLQKAAHLAGLKVTNWNSLHEDGQVFEAWLRKPGYNTAPAGR